MSSGERHPNDPFAWAGSPVAAALARGMVRYRWGLLALAVVMAAVTWLPASRLGFDRTIENMFAADDPLLPPFRRLERTFGGTEVALAAYVDPDLMTPKGIRRVHRLTEKLRAVDGVTSVVSLTSTPLGEEIISDQVRGPAFLDLFEGYVVGDDYETAGLACLLDPYADSAQRAETVNELHRVLDENAPGAVLAGEPVMLVEGFRLVEEDGLWLGRLCTVLLMLVIVASFRSLRWMILPMLVVNFTLIVTKALLVASQLELTIVSSMLWSIVTVAGTATVIHVAVRYRETRETGAAPREALIVAGTFLAVPVAWTCFTDAAGFAALLAAEVSPVHDFGFMMVIGSLVALGAVALIVPGLALVGHRDLDPHRAWGEGRLDRILRGSLATVLKRPKTFAAGTFVFVGVVAVGALRLQVETDFTKNFRQSSPLVRSYELIESRLGGAGVWDVVVPAPPPDELSETFLDRLYWLQYRLETEVRVLDEQGDEQPGVTKSMSLVDALDTVPTPRLLAADVLLRTKFRRFQEEMPDIAPTLYGEDPREPGSYFARVMLRSRERQPAEQKQRLINAVDRISREEFPASAGRPPARATGFFVLLASLIKSVIRDQWTTFAVAILGVGVLMTLAFRSPRLAAVALIPNILPVLLVLGGLGWLDLKTNMGVAMIAAVSLGLSIDSEIHYITAFRRARGLGYTVRESLEHVQQNVGRAVVFATVALVVGFAGMCFSDFVPTIYFGGLVSLSMFIGVLANLLLLPLLLHLALGRKSEAGPGD